MRSCATDLIRLKTSLLVLLGLCVITFAQDSKCNIPKAAVTCEKGQQAHCIPKGDGTWDVECVTVSPSDKATDQSLREQQVAIPRNISSSYSATARFLASSQYGIQIFPCYPLWRFDGFDWTKREAEWRKKVLEEPNNFANHYYLGQSLLNNRKLLEAEIEFRSIIDRVPPPPYSRYWVDHWWFNALRELGIDLFAQGKYAEAEKAFQRFVEEDAAFDGAFNRKNNFIIMPDYCSFYMLALAQAARQNYQDAESSIKKSEFEPYAVSSYTLFASVLFDQGKFPEAEQAYRKALSFLNPFSLEDKYLRTLRVASEEGLLATLLKQGKYLDVETSTEQLARDTNEAWLIFRTGISLLKQGKYTDAEKSFKEAIALEPTTIIFREALEISKRKK